MTSVRRYGDDTPFGRWVREQNSLESRQHGFTANDADWIFHKYKTNIDGNGSRSVQLMMLCEVKTRLATPNKDQQETLYFMHQLLNQKRVLRRPFKGPVSVWHFGVYVLRMEGEAPKDGEEMAWGRFDAYGSIRWRTTRDTRKIVQLLGFSRAPDNPDETLRARLRRHHHAKTIERTIRTELGFRVAESQTVRS